MKKKNEEREENRDKKEKTKPIALQHSKLT